ncbi:hypothetical protein [Arthrobacter zhaoxinii]|uniref:hypothetical protein n=1 Tax=Arthrobacter zhaoxinii TaxID=2964616 RepID=UPI00210677CE|nr:hypothetical protein [Arthrobacter zhaoxinii]MCQ2001467.1 hypothetical protein [Arthrobacter zhaoxinii]
MIGTKDDTTAGTGTAADFGSLRCLWPESVCVDPPTHFVAQELADGRDAEVFCVRHYVLTLARICEVHLPLCEGDFAGHVDSHGEL